MEDVENPLPSEEELSQVAEIFKRLGAEEAAAIVMAKQLLKRARQIAQDREIPYLTALQGLLQQVVEARSDT